jgi:RND family efflux transporter MFP subunit
MKIKAEYLNIFLSVIISLSLVDCGKTEKQDEVIVPVKIYKVKPESLTQYLKLTGTISAGKDQIVFSKISERIEGLYVKPGDRVNTNQIITRQYNALFSQGVEAAQANLANAEAQLELAEQNFKRMERLYNQRAVSTQQFEQSSTQYKAATSALEAARAQLQQATEQLENTIIKAPFSGVVAAVYIEKNQMVPAGQQIAQIIDPSTMKSKIRVASRDINLIKKGKDVEILVPTLSHKSYKGRVISIDRAVDPISKTFEVEVLINDADNYLKSGMYAEFTIPIISVENSIVVPETAMLSQTEVQINKQTGLQETSKRYFLFVVENQRAKMKEVKVGLLSNSRAQITAGINLNDSVIVVGNNIVQENQKVNIID